MKMKNNLAKTNSQFLFLVGFTIFSFLFGILFIRHHINSPFSQPKKLAKLSGINLKEQEKLIYQDTDKDGIPDLKELSIGTSPYLADSDSDGFSDKEEIDNNSNPLDPNSTPLNKIASQTPVVLEQLVGSATVNPSSLEKFLKGEPSLAEIREILITQGHLPKEIVDKIDDKTLLKLYNETKAELSEGLKKGELKTFDFTELSDQLFGKEIDENFFKLLSGAQIRRLLIEAGMDKKMLEGIDDETLKNLFLEAIKNKTK